MSTKLNVILAKTEHLGKPFGNMIKDFLGFFKGSQGAFKGLKKTYAPREGTIDEAGMRQYTGVVTTVDEKLDWLKENAAEYIDNLFAVEATNSSGLAMTNLVVEGVDWGIMSSLELLRLKSLIETESFEQMYANIPVRSDAEIWKKSENEEYKARAVYEKALESGVKKSLTKEPYILPDPNLENLKDTSKYQPQVVARETTMELGDYTKQDFSGEYSHIQRALILKRISTLKVAVIEALKKANDVEVANSHMNANKLFSYLHEGKL